MAYNNNKNPPGWDYLDVSPELKAAVIVKYSEVINKYTFCRSDAIAETLNEIHKDAKFMTRFGLHRKSWKVVEEKLIQELEWNV